jgi:hypothetical protein
MLLTMSRELAILIDMPNVGIYINQPLQDRIDRLKAAGAELNTSTICQRALDAAVQAEELALQGDRMARLLARLQTARTPGEQARADGEAAGRAWAEDIATLSELRQIRQLGLRMAREHLEVDSVDLGPTWSVLGLLQWEMGDDGEPNVAGQTSAVLPASVPRDFLEHASDPVGGTVYRMAKVEGFVDAASDVLGQVEAAMAMAEGVKRGEAARDLVEEVRAQLTANLAGTDTKNRPSAPRRKRSKEVKPIEFD